ncbi:PAS domain S-box protein [Vibrio sp. JPW-9-11-11]|uniref:ATP-binding protein n=1 Tax=Vibrio sp. JPW-9-11-11 TaxID=1416532 RepID=UPI001593FAA2|nr:ATP-binding protein [Vibrio sp. JPW-9-11-11]NVD06575.1 PAS domain S-box protein [Vibrio sp. JPW-9-11-11]
MLKFDKKNGMHLFALFIIVGAGVFLLTSFVFIQHQAQKTAQLVINESVRSKVTTVERYVNEYIDARLDRLANIVEHPLLLGAVLEGVDTPLAFSDQLARFKPVTGEAYVNVYDFAGERVYSELVLPTHVTDFLKVGVEDQSLLEQSSSSVFSQRQRDYLMVTLPVKYNGLAEGLAAYIAPLSDGDFFSGLGSDSLHWFGLAQSRMNWETPSPHEWPIAQKPLENTTFTMLYSYSPALVEEAQQNFVQSLLLGMLLATFVALMVLVAFGRKVLVSPFQALYESEQQLIKQSKELQRKEAESARLARVVTYMRDAVVFTDLESHIVWVNNAFEQLTGYSEREVIGRKPGEFLQGERTDKQTTREIRRAIDERRYGFFELVNYKKTGELYWIELALMPLYDKEGELEGFMAVERDITQRVELQESLQQKAIEANAANIAKSKFLAAMSHELRTPMNGILGVGELLQHTPLNSEQQDYVETFLSSGRHMLAVLNDILDFSKIESGKLKLEQRDFSLQAVADKLARMYQPLCEEKGLAFDCHCHFADHTHIRGDETRVIQILQNLLNNAWKFTIKGGVTLELDLNSATNGDWLVMRVKDTGIGISRDKQALIFDPFSQAETETTRRFGGTGLGLAIITELVKAMQGEVHVDSMPTLGSTFTVTIPVSITQAVNTDEPTLHQQAFDGKGMSVLIVEDTRVNAIVLGRFLTQKGFSHQVAVNGLEALELVKQKHFDFILMDNHMPIMDGIQATEAITQLDLQPKPIIIGCTADAFEETRQKMLTVGCTEVITKPISSKKLDEIFFVTQRAVTSETT